VSRANISLRNRILGASLSHASILGLNALLAECPEVLLEHFSAELPTFICQAIANKDVSERPIGPSYSKLIHA
jgi:hypothetical protein